MFFLSFKLFVCLLKYLITESDTNLIPVLITLKGLSCINIIIIVIIVIIMMLTELVSIIMVQGALKKYMQSYSTCGKRFTKNSLVDYAHRTSMWYEWMPVITIAANLAHETMATCQPVHQHFEINMAWKMILVEKKKTCDNLKKTMKKESILLYQVQEILYFD